MPQAHLPDGRILDFPEGTPDDVIDGVVKREMGLNQPASSAVNDENIPTDQTGGPSTIERIGRAAVNAPMSVFNAGRDVGRAVGQGVYDFATRKPAENLPEIGGAHALTYGEAGKMATPFLVEHDPEKLGEIFTKQIPGATMRKDKDGAVVVNVRGKDYYVNKPGPSGQDLMDLLAMAPYAVAAALGGGAGGAILGTAGRIVGTGVGTGLYSLAEDVGSRLFGSSRTPSLVKAGTAAALSMLFEGGAAGFTALKRAFQVEGYFDAKNALTDAGRRAVTRMGLDPEKLTPEVNAQLKPILLKAANPEDALRLAEAKGLGVKLTRGQVTGDVTQQATEAAALRGGMGQDAADVAQGFQTEQQQALRGAVRQTQGKVGGANIESPGQGMEAVQSRLAAGREQLKGQVNTAYEAARATGASLNREGLDTVQKAVSDEFKASWNPLTAPKTAGMVAELKAPANLSAVKVNALENWRQQVSQLARSSDPVEAGAAKAVLRKFDDALMNSVDDAMIRGDTGALEAFRNARSLRYQLFNRYESNNIVADLIEGGTGNLKLQPSEAVNKLFGASIANKQGAANAVLKIRDLLGPDSPEWKALKEEAFMRLMKSQGADVMEEGARSQFSGAKFAKAVDGAMRDAPELMKALFTPQDLGAIQQLKRVMVAATESKPGAVNYSGTAYEAARMLDRLGFLGRQGRAVVETVLKPFMKTSAKLTTERAIENPLPLAPLLQGEVLNPRQFAVPLTTEEALKQYRRLRAQ